MLKPDNVIALETSQDDLFKYWLTFLRPFHNLAKREIEVAAAILKYRHELSKKIIDDDTLNLVLLNDDSKKYYMNVCNMRLQQLQVVISTLKLTGIIIDGKINPRYIPKYDDSKGTFLLMLHFTVK